MRLSVFIALVLAIVCGGDKTAFAEQAEFWTIVHEITGDSPAAVIGQRIKYRELTSLAPKAYVSYSNNSAIVHLSRGIITMLSRDQLKFVIAHELAHVANNKAAAITGSLKLEDECSADKLALRLIGGETSQIALSSLKKINDYWREKNITYPSLITRIGRLENYFSSLSRN